MKAISNFSGKLSRYIRASAVKIRLKTVCLCHNISIHFHFPDWGNAYRLIPVIGFVPEGDQQRLVGYLKQIPGSDRFQEFQTEHYLGIDFFLSPEIECLLFSPIRGKSAPSDINQNLESRLNYEFELWKEKIASFGQFDMASSFILWCVDEYARARFAHIGFFSMEWVKYRNTFQKYCGFFREFEDNAGRPGLFDYNTDTKNHIRHFARIYYCIITILKAIEPLQKKSVTIHDVGTNVAYFPLLLNYLAAKGEAGLFPLESVMVSDLCISHKNHVKHVCRLNHMENRVVFRKIDLLNRGMEIPGSDVVTIIDVLEHFSSLESVEEVLQRLWEKTGCILIVHVPFEEVPNPFWGHQLKFNAQLLRTLGGKLTGGNIVSDYFTEIDKKNLTEHGYLIVERRVCNPDKAASLEF